MTQYSDISRMIDHTLLKPEATELDIIELSNEALSQNFKSVCVNPVWVPIAAKLLKGSEVEVCTVVGFPLGANTLTIKKNEALEALQNGATEIDMVINIGKLKAGEFNYVKNEIKELTELTHENNAVLKVIIETALLTKEEIRKVTQIIIDENADFVKTSTGFSESGATVEDVTIMNQVVNEKIGIKASGGIKTGEFAKELIEAGATRIGASSGKKIVEEISKL